MAERPVVGGAAGPVGPDRFADLVEEAIRRADQVGSAVSLVVVDLQGPAPATPRTVDELLSSLVRSTDVIGRLADGTHGVLVDGPRPSAHRVAERLCTGLAGAFPGTGAWAGLAATEGRGSRPEALVAAAGHALGRARSGPPGTVVEADARIDGQEGRLGPDPDRSVADLLAEALVDEPDGSSWREPAVRGGRRRPHREEAQGGMLPVGRHPGNRPEARGPVHGRAHLRWTTAGRAGPRDR